VEDRIAAACAAAGRDRSQVRLVVVTKTYPAADVLTLSELGVGDVGESRQPEAGRKHDACQQAGCTSLRWHFVGALQTNKAASVARFASLVHSVDRLRLVAALDRGAARAERTVECLVQVDLDTRAGANDQRSGAASGDVAAVADAIAAAEHLTLRGVMAVAPLDADPAEAFERLAAISAAVATDHPGADVISAGMSGDLEEAVAAGTTLLRVGRAILGERPPLR
jgi:pyridoxal phosphate enzyme (YggS family)